MKALLAIFVLGSLFLLAGCGSGEDSTPPAVDPKAGTSPVSAGQASGPQKSEGVKPTAQ